MPLSFPDLPDARLSLIKTRHVGEQESGQGGGGAAERCHAGKAGPSPTRTTVKEEKRAVRPQHQNTVRKIALRVGYGSAWIMMPKLARTATAGSTSCLDRCGAMGDRIPGPQVWLW